MLHALLQIARIIYVLTQLACLLTCPECGGESWSNGPGYHQLTCNGCGHVHQE